MQDAPSTEEAPHLDNETWPQPRGHVSSPRLRRFLGGAQAERREQSRDLGCKIVAELHS